jgi:hypothetical protein
MATKFALNDAADFDSNIAAFSAALDALDSKLGPALAQKLKGSFDREKTLDALLAAIAAPAAKT